MLLGVVAASLLLMGGAVAHSRVAPAAVAGGLHAKPAAAAGPAYFSTTWLSSHPAPELGVTAQAGILVDLDTRQVLWARAEHAQRAPASLTKLTTAVVALDHARMDRAVTVPDTAVGVDPDLMGLSAGEVVTVQDLLYGLFLDSGNDAAETLAQTILPRDRFLADMNAKARAWGLRETAYTNPSGLDTEGLHSSAYDLAVVAAHVDLEHPELMAIAGTKEHPIPATAQHKAYDPYNLNKLLWNYPGATGLKTGFTDDAGGCVIGTATRNGRHLAAVVLGSDIFFTDARRLLDYGFSVSG